MSFLARYNDTCPTCMGPINAGEQVKYDESTHGAVVHTHHVSEKSCPQCHLIHAGECM